MLGRAVADELEKQGRTPVIIEIGDGIYDNARNGGYLASQGDAREELTLTEAQAGLARGGR